MKRYLVPVALLFSNGLWAHHTRDHLMLAEDAEQVVAATREGGGAGWLSWTVLAVILLLGALRWWQKRS